jgi:dTDP-4-dehydrorhamnose 3,5-epimerase
MKFTPTVLPEVIVVEPVVFRDDRGFFLETYNRERYLEGGIDAVFVQDNHSRSVRDTVRGLHAQWRRPQGKLLRVIQGEIYDVAVDIRLGSPRYLQWVAVTLSADNYRQLYVPPGFAHGFCVTSDIAEVEYKCTDLYDPEGELRILWNDPQIGVEWPAQEPILSEKDRTGQPVDAWAERLPRYGERGGEKR